MIITGIEILNFIHYFQKAVSRYAAFWFYLLLLVPLIAFADEQQEDTIYNILPDIEVRQSGRSPIRKTDDGKVTIKTKDILLLSRTFGEADLIDRIRTLPLAESNGDYGSGISVNGTDPGQAQYLIDGAPVIFPYRFGGIFSTFNASHFSSMNFSRISTSDLPPRLGAAFLLSPALRFESGVEGSCSAGMTASSLSLRAGVSDRFALSISGRISYIDRLYGNWLSDSEMGIRYNFHDLNADAQFKVSQSDIFSLTLLQSADNLTYDDSKYALDTSIRWNNSLYSFGFRHEGETKFRFNLHHSRFADRLALAMPQMLIEAPASLSTSGADFCVGKSMLSGNLFKWDCGIKIVHDHTIPQWARLEMSDTGSAAIRASDSYPQNMLTAIAYFRTGWWILDRRIRLNAETGVGWFSSKTKRHPDYSSLIFTPSISITGNLKGGTYSLYAAYLNQPLHRVGFSELGLATDFWIGAYENAPVQRSFALSGNVTRRLPWWNLDVEAGAFWNCVSNQVEYQGQVIETIDTEYSPFSHLIVSDGYNYGVFASLARSFGQLTGDLNLSYSSGRRHDCVKKEDSWSSLYAQGFVMKASALWNDGNHWTFSASFRLASGRRYTPVESMYMIGENIAMEYGERNSARLPLYNRLDIGATYYFSSGSKFKFRNIINLSVFNVYGQKNVEMQYFILNSLNGDYHLKRLYSMYRFLPSLSYTIEFR